MDNNEPLSYNRDHFVSALSYALEDLGSAKELVLRYLEDKHSISLRDGKLPSIEQVENALREIFGSGADAIIPALKEKLGSDR